MNKKYKLISLHNATTGKVHHVALTKEIKLEKFIQGAATRWANSLKKKYNLDKIHQIKYEAYIWAESTNLLKLDALKYLLFDKLNCDIDTLKPYPAKGNTEEAIKQYIQDHPMLESNLKSSRYGNIYTIRLYKSDKKVQRSRESRDNYYSALKRLLENRGIQSYAQQISQLSEIINQVDIGIRHQLSGFLRHVARERISSWEKELVEIKEKYLEFKEPWKAREVLIPKVSGEELILTSKWAFTFPNNTMLVASPDTRKGWCRLDYYLDIDNIANPSRRVACGVVPWNDKSTYWNFKRIYLASKLHNEILTVGVKKSFNSYMQGYSIRLYSIPEKGEPIYLDKECIKYKSVRLPHTTKVINSFAKVLHKTVS